MTSLVPVDSERLDLIEKVNALKLKQYTPAAIAKELGLKRAVVLELIEEWKFALANDEEARERAREALREMDKHYNIIIRKYWEIVEELEQMQLTPPVAAQRLSALKGAADADAKRLESLQKAGLLEDNELADQLADMEEKQGILVSILRNDLCPECKANVAVKLQKVTQTVEVVKVV